MIYSILALENMSVNYCNENQTEGTEEVFLCVFYKLNDLQSVGVEIEASVNHGAGKTDILYSV